MALSKLASELKKRRPFEVVEEEVYLNVLRTAQWLQHDAERVLKPYGLSEATYNVLRILRGARSEGRESGEMGLPCLEVASRMVTRVPDITRLVDRLIARGYVTRTRSEEDRRVVRVAITDQGLDVLKELDGPIVDCVVRQLSALTRTELDDLNRLLVKAREVVGHPCESVKA
jgi:DNA-binding MarR family transcriptional regulator